MNVYEPVSSKAAFLFVLLGCCLLQFWAATAARAQTGSPEYTVSGKVTDTSGKVLTGVTINVKDQPTVGTSSDIQGLYILKLKDPAAVLMVSFVGYAPQEIPVANRREIDIVMTESYATLDETVVVAFGTQKKKEMVGSVSSVNPSELRIPSSNLTTALAGRVAGLVAYQRSGEPGQDNADFFIRGVTTFGYGSSPLILIDGVEMRSEDLARLQPDDIASFSIMKDASATALYGARGANGVILVNTKGGKEGKAQVSVRYEHSISSPTRKVELADPITYMRMGNEAVLTRDPLGILPYSQEKIESTEKGLYPVLFPNTNWQQLLFKDNAVNDRVNFNVSGGGKVAKYYIAGTYNQDNGILKVDGRNNFNSNIDLKKYLLRSNIDIKLTQTTDVTARLHATFDDYTGPLDGGTDLFNKVMRTNPVLFPAYYEPDAKHETVEHILFGNYGKGDYINPYADLMKGYKDYTKSLMMSQFELKQDLGFLLKGLKMRGVFSTNRYSYFDVRRFYTPFYYALGGYDKQTGVYTLTGLNPESGQEHLDYAEGGKEITSNTYVEAAVNYDTRFGTDHSLNAMLVYIQRNALVANAGSLQKSLPYRNMGVSGRLSYGYKSRYFLEGNFGYNGSERFDVNNRFGFFPSVGGGWVVSSEPFWKEGLTNIMQLLKLRFTYGLVGNDAIGSADDRFFYLSQMNMDNSSRGYTFGYDFQYALNGVSVTRYANANITWETSHKTNLGIEMKLLNALTINTDIYWERRTNILMDRAFIPGTMGLQSTPRSNVGEMRGRGIDASLDYQANFGKDFWLAGRANFTYAVNKISVYEEPDYSETPWKSVVGNAYGQRWGFVAERLFVDEYEVKNSPFQGSDVMAGDIKYKDINNDGQINELDQVPIGFPTVPQIIYGFGVSMGYRSVDLSAFFQGLGRESFWIDAAGTAPFIGTNGNALLKAYADSYWSEENRDLYALWPRLSNKVNANNNAVSTWFMQNGSFLRLKSLELGYTLPAKLTSRWKISKVRFYGSGVNLLTFSSFKLWDPEMAGNGLNYPVQKVVNAGVQVTF